VRKAIQMPARQIAINAGADGSVVVGKIMDKDQYSYGLDAQTGEYGNLVTKGIIDPTKVVRCALQGAVSVAALLITTEATVPKYRRRSPQRRQRPVAAWAGWITNPSTPSTKKTGFPRGPYLLLLAQDHSLAFGSKADMIFAHR
jgi:TCP-1/cpn60 chaperonin family